MYWDSYIILPNDNITVASKVRLEATYCMLYHHITMYKYCTVESQ